MAVGSLYETPVFAGLADAAEACKTHFVLKGAAAARLALIEKVQRSRYARLDLVDLCPFMERVELQLTDHRFDAAQIRAALRGGVSFADQAEIELSSIEAAPTYLEIGLPILRLRVSRDGLFDPDRLMDKLSGGELSCDWAGIPSAAVTRAVGARAISLLADFQEVFGGCKLDALSRSKIASSFDDPAGDLGDLARDIQYWLTAAEARFGALYPQILDELGLLSSIQNAASRLGWLAPGPNRVLSPNLNPIFKRTQIAFSQATLSSDRASEVMDVRVGDELEPLVSFYAFEIARPEDDAIIEVSVAHAAAEDLSYQDKIAALWVANPADLEDVAVSLLPVVLLPSVSPAAQQLAFRIAAPPLVAAVREFGPVAFFVKIMREVREEDDDTLEIEKSGSGTNVAIPNEQAAEAMTTTMHLRIDGVANYGEWAADIFRPAEKGAKHKPAVRLLTHKGEE